MLAFCCGNCASPSLHHPDTADRLLSRFALSPVGVRVGFRKFFFAKLNVPMTILWGLWFRIYMSLGFLPFRLGVIQIWTWTSRHGSINMYKLLLLILLHYCIVVLYGCELILQTTVILLKLYALVLITRRSDYMVNFATVLLDTCQYHTSLNNMSVRLQSSRMSSGRITVGPEGAWPTWKTWRPPRNIRFERVQGGL